MIQKLAILLVSLHLTFGKTKPRSTISNRYNMSDGTVWDLGTGQKVTARVGWRKNFFFPRISGAHPEEMNKISTAITDY